MQAFDSSIVIMLKNLIQRILSYLAAILVTEKTHDVVRAMLYQKSSSYNVMTLCDAAQRIPCFREVEEETGCSACAL